jgi:aspartyl-tRNA(Asn)/glutamyl-tRNA(Gln) amidotransferase subunit C
MPAIDLEQVRHVARLARLELTDAEIELFARQLGDVLDYVRALDAAPTAGVAPLAQPLVLQNVLRPDEPVEPLPIDAAIRNAPAAGERGFEVPAVLESGA